MKITMELLMLSFKITALLIMMMNGVCSIQHYVIKFVRNLRQDGGFLRFPPPIKLTAKI